MPSGWESMDNKSLQFRTVFNTVNVKGNEERGIICITV